MMLHCTATYRSLFCFLLARVLLFFLNINWLLRNTQWSQRGDYVMGNLVQETICHLMSFLVPNHKPFGKSDLTIGFNAVEEHRSVVRVV